MTRRFLLTLAVAGLISLTALADQPVPSRRMGIRLTPEGLAISYSAADLLHGEAEKKLDSGLPQRIVVQHFVYQSGRSEPLSAGGHSCKIVYDLWQGLYRVEYERFGYAASALAYPTRREVIERCLIMRDFPLGTIGDYAGVERVYVGSLIELNPLSSSTVARIRRWLSRPRGEYNVETKSFFGSFVSLFVNSRIGTAERVLRVRSQDVELTPWQ
ncbi:MAG TPA: hypothetical protein VG963_16840 [Polyangiaceae bacterium]|nr:hypothetical protein [Polyangiaceae bacterium]